MTPLLWFLISAIVNELLIYMYNKMSENNLLTSKKVFIKTYGCQMNVYDSQRMSDSLAGVGYHNTENINEADLILVNTCHIREKAAEKLYSDLGRLRVKRQKSDKTKIHIGVMGCVAQAEGEEILKRAPIVDLIVGPQAYHRLPQILDKVENGKKIIDTEYSTEDKFAHLPNPQAKVIAKRGVSAFLTVQEGCDKFCTFCVVPYTRGAQISRSANQIINEAKILIEAGVKEITLLGQNVNAWQDEMGHGLGYLISKLAQISDLKRLRYTTSHPNDMNEELLEAHRDINILMPYLHLPVQSGSDKILKAMNRQHTAKQYLQLIEKIKTYCPDMAFSGDFIVGFPGETNEDFTATMKLINEVNYSASYSFKYSPRPGTPGATMNNIVEENIKDARLAQMQSLLRQQQTNFLNSKIGNSTQILVEKPGRYEGQIIGRSPWLLPVVTKSQASTGEMLTVTITNASTNSFVAQAST